MEKSLTKIGNSMGFIVPKDYVEYLSGVFEIEMTSEGLLLKPKKKTALSLNELLKTQDMNKLYAQMEQDANDSEIQEFYNSSEVQNSDNLDEIIDEY